MTPKKRVVRLSLYERGEANFFKGRSSLHEEMALLPGKGGESSLLQNRGERKGGGKCHFLSGKDLWGSNLFR